MNALVIGRVAVANLFNTPRGGLPGPLLHEFERTTNAVEQLFTVGREALRSCPTFTALAATDRAKIERELFEVRLRD